MLGVGFYLYGIMALGRATLFISWAHVHIYNNS